MKNYIPGIAAVSGCLFLSVAPVFGQVNIPDVTFPADARIINVKNYGAVGDGVTDDTIAIQNALSNLVGLTYQNGVDHIIYLPNGIYKVSRQLFFNTGFQRYCTLEGQSRTGTIIKLVDNAPGFTDPANPQSVVSTLRATPGSGDSFRNYIRDLTVDTGNGNTGAVGIDYISNNTGAIYNVTIRSSSPNGAGVVGLRMTQGIDLGPGPSLIKNVSVSGFDTGIQTAIFSYSLDFEHITLSGQRVCAIANDKNILVFRDLTSVNSVPVYKGTDLKSMFEVIEGTFSGGGSTVAAVDNHLGGMVHLRDVNVSGYGTAISDVNGTTATGFVSEYLTYGMKSASGTAVQTLRLPIQETPDVAWDAPTTWANIEKYGAISGDSGKNFAFGNWTDTGDDSVAIQKAIDSGATTVYFPNGIYNICNTIHIRGNVRRIIGMDSTLQCGATLAASGQPIFKFENGTAPVVIFERFDIDYGTLVGNFMEHAANRTLVMRGCATGNYATNGGTGDVFFEDVTLNAKIVRQRAWFRQYNPEGGEPQAPTIHLLNDGGTVWCLGMKSEGVAIQVKTINGGKTEVLGGMLASTNYVFSTTPAIASYGSATCVVSATGVDPAAQQTSVVDDRFNGTTVNFLNTDFPWRSLSEYQAWSGLYAPAGNFYFYQGYRPTIPFGKTISMKAQVNGLYVTAENAGASPLIANRTAVGTWEQFGVNDMGGNQNVSLWSFANNSYVCAENGGNSPLIANRPTASLWETFQWIDLGNGLFALKSQINGLYVTAPSNGTGSLIANGTTLDSAATFQYTTYPAAATPSVALGGVTLVKNANKTITATITLRNTGGADAVGVALTASAIGSQQTTTPLAVSIDRIAAGGSVTQTLTFPAIASRTSTTFSLSGTYYSGNTFSLSSRVTTP